MAMRNLLKVLLIVLYLLAGYGQYFERLADLGESSALLLASYLGLFAILALALLLAAFIRNDAWRWSWAVLLAAGGIFCDSYIRISGSYLTYSIFVSHFYSVSAIDEAILQYWPTIRVSLALGLMLLAGLGMRPALSVALRPAPEHSNAPLPRAPAVGRAFVLACALAP